jgi:arginase
MNWQLTGVPYTSMRAPGGIAEAIAVLRACGLAGRVGEHGVPDAGDLELEPPSGERGVSGLLNERALGRLVEATRARVRATCQRGHRALLVGGDCPVFLGALAALRDDRGDRGLVMLDGHEDAWPPSLSETGEASDSELAIALAMVEHLPEPLDRLVPLIRRSAVALLGPRDRAEVEAGGARSIRDEIAFFADDEEIRRHGATETAQAALDAIDAIEVWLHIDLDALSSHSFAAVDYRQPGGLDWDQLDRLATTAALDARCRGASIAIYNPDLDPHRTAGAMVVDFISRLVERAQSRARRGRCPGG